MKFDDIEKKYKSAADEQAERERTASKDHQSKFNAFQTAKQSLIPAVILPVLERACTMLKRLHHRPDLLKKLPDGKGTVPATIDSEPPVAGLRFHLPGAIKARVHPGVGWVAIVPSLNDFAFRVYVSNVPVEGHQHTPHALVGSIDIRTMAELPPEEAQAIAEEEIGKAVEHQIQWESHLGARH